MLYHCSAPVSISVSLSDDLNKNLLSLFRIKCGILGYMNIFFNLNVTVA